MDLFSKFNVFWSFGLSLEFGRIPVGIIAKKQSEGVRL